MSDSAGGIHSCFVVPDVTAAIAELRDLAGLRFRKIARIPFRFEHGDEVVEQVVEVAYALDGSLELVRATGRGPFRSPDRAGPHHVGYAVEDLEAAVTEHRDRGHAVAWRIFVDARLIAVLLDGGPLGAVPVELLDRRFVSGSDRWNEHVAPGI